MKITDTRSKHITYGELSIGSCFEVCGKFFIKTDIIEDSISMNRYSVNLNTGEKYRIEKTVEITTIQTELLIK